MELADIKIEDVNKSTKDYIKKNYMPYLVAYIVLFLIMVAFLYFTEIEKVEDKLEVILKASMYYLALGAIAYAYVYSKIEAEFIKQFGASIGFTYTKSGLLTSVGGKLFEIGHSKNIVNVLEGIYKEIPLRIFQYRYVVGSGKHSTTYKYFVYEIDFKNKMPEMILSSFRTGGDDFIDIFSDYDVLKLESNDFNKMFQLRIPKGDATKSLEIFTPDVMHNLMQKAEGFNFEFTKEKLYIYTKKTLSNTENAKESFYLVKYFFDILNRNIENRIHLDK